MALTREEFIEYYGASMTPEEKTEFIKTQVVLPCNCEYEECQGWQMKSKDLFEQEKTFSHFEQDYSREDISYMKKHNLI